MSERDILKIKDEIDIYIHNIFLKEQSSLIIQNIQIDINYLLELINIINLNISKYLYNKRKEIRLLINNNTYSISDLNNYIIYYLNKIDIIYNLLKSLNNNIFKTSNYEQYEKNIDMFISLILNDVNTLKFLENIFTDFDNINLYSTDILNFLNNIKNLLKDNNNKYIICINKISNLFINKLYNNNIFYNNFIPDNINHVYKLNYIINYVKNINKYFYSIITYVNKLIGPILYNNIIYIINNNTVSEVSIIFDKLWYMIYAIYHNDEYNKKIVNNIILLLKNTTDINDIINIFDIIIICFQIFSSKYLNLLNLALTDKFKKDINLLYIIMDYYYNNNSYTISPIILFNDRNIISENNIVHNKYTILLNIIINSTDKDLILNIHYKLFTKKLFNNYNNPYFLEIIENEKIYYNIINKNIKDNKLTYNIIKTINDLIESYKFNKKIAMNNVNIIVTSYGNNIINYDEGYIYTKLIDNNYQLGNILSMYHNKYTQLVKNCTHLLWYLHYGEINITYNNIDIKMLPIHFLILELYTDKSQILINDINNLDIFLNYSADLKYKIIHSMIESNLLYIDNNYLVLNTNSNFESDLIDIYLNITNYKNNIDINELMLSREDIAKSNIIHILKTCQLSYSDLFSKIVLEIKVFKLSQDIFNKALDYLIKMDYIIYSNNLYIYKN